jgi:LysM repeat protein
MTRETKIGLLVGLAFIIVVGILLSEHLTTATERPAAALADAGEGLRTGVAAPGVATHETREPYRPADPVSLVPTARDLTPQPQPLPPQVAVGPGATSQHPIIIDQRNPQSYLPPTVTITHEQPPVVGGPGPTRPPGEPLVKHNHPLQTFANAQGEPLITVTPQPGTTRNTPLAANNAREYKAQPGDTLSRIASLLPGGNTKANRDAVVALNPALAKDPNKVIAGRTYLLPTDKSASVVLQTPAPAVAPAPLVERASPVVRTETPAAAYRTYTVQKGDSLTKIAIEQLGSKSELATLRKLNEDVLKGSDLIKIDMKLKLPAKTSGQVAVSSGQ